MSSSHLLDPYIIAIIAEKNKSYLDIGAGHGKWGYLLKISHKPPSYTIGGDIDTQAINFLKKHQTYDSLVILDARHLPFRNKTFDITLCLEVLEHLEKRDVITLFKEHERAAKEKTVYSTPLLGATYWYSKDYHTSNWTPGDFRKNGYTVRGVGFSLFGKYTTEKLAFGLAPLAYYFPWMSFILLAWKETSL